MDNQSACEDDVIHLFGGSYDQEVHNIKKNLFGNHQKTKNSGVRQNVQERTEDSNPLLRQTAELQKISTALAASGPPKQTDKIQT